MQNSGKLVKGRKKDYFSSVNVQLTKNEDAKLAEICERDRRNRSEEVLWLIEKYHGGELADAQRLAFAYDKAIREAYGLPSASPGTEPTRVNHIGSVSGALKPDEPKGKQANS